MWKQWASQRRENLIEDCELEHKLCDDFPSCTEESLALWLPKFVVEVRKGNGEPYPPNSLYQICCGLHRSLKAANRAELNIFDSPRFVLFRDTLDSQMKLLKASGNFETRKAQPITENPEDLLWMKGALGTTSPQRLLDTLVFYIIGLYFALRSGSEHRRLRHKPSQLKLFQPPGERAYLQYTEDVSKTNQGGLKHRKKEAKVVVQYENRENPSKCIVALYKEYNKRCPANRPDGAFYLKPLVKP